MAIQNPGTTKESIQYHYDVSNDFYSLWLDKTLTYSCGIWNDHESYGDLENAQLRKLDYHLDQAKVTRAKCVLDIGCGWGSGLSRSVDKFKCEHGVGLTLSPSQAAYITQLNNPKIDVLLQSWSDHKPDTPYDAIISLGAFGHFAKAGKSSEEKIKGYRDFFSSCHTFLKSGGRMSLQTLGYGDVNRTITNNFIAESVFPESDIPTLAEITMAAEPYFEIISIVNNRYDYALTCRAWLKNLKERRSDAIKIVGETIVARYERFLALGIFGCETGFNAHWNIVLRRLDSTPT